MYLGIENVLDISAVIITFVAIIILYVASKRFLSKEFKRIVNWIAITSVVFFVFQVSVLILGIFTLVLMEEWHIINASFVILVSLCFIKIAYEINKFSKVFGFAKPEERFAEAFIKGIKKRGGK